MIMMMTVITGQFLVQCNNFCANNLSQAVPFSGNGEPRVSTSLLILSRTAHRKTNQIDFNVARAIKNLFKTLQFHVQHPNIVFFINIKLIV